METYKELPVAEAYELLNPGGLILVCTRSPAGRYDLAPIAWACPLDYEPSSRILFVCDPAHETWTNLKASGSFVVATPTRAQTELVEAAGSISGRDVDKYERFNIAARRASEVDALVPEGVGAWLECRLRRTVEEGSVSIVMGDVLRAWTGPEAWKDRLHYVREGLMYVPGERIE